MNTTFECSEEIRNKIFRLMEDIVIKERSEGKRKSCPQLLLHLICQVAEHQWLVDNELQSEAIINYLSFWEFDHSL